jgi:Enoyl-CoA hydratase/carnithine racemase
MSEIVRYEKKDRIARIILNRPECYNAISSDMPGKLRECVDRADQDENVRVIILEGAGEGFSTGYDMEEFAETPRPTKGSQEMPWDPTLDYKMMKQNTEDFMSLWNSPKPTICKIHGYAVGGGSDIALCCDIIIMGKNAKIGYPPARVWGCPTTGMWVYKLGAERAKRMLLTGDLIDGKEAEKIGLVYKAVEEESLEEEVENLANKMATIPKNQLMMQKLMINQAYENMGLETTQKIATLFDGIARHTPEGVKFKESVKKSGLSKQLKNETKIF